MTDKSSSSPATSQRSLPEWVDDLDSGDMIYLTPAMAKELADAIRSIRSEIAPRQRALEELLARVQDGELLIQGGECSIERAWHMATAQANRIDAAPASVPSATRESELPPAECYVLAIHQSIGSILSSYSAKKIMDRAKDIANGN